MATPARGLYKIKTIAELSGFTPTLLRAWERRYDILEPERTGTGHRLYTDEDLRVLQEIKQHLDRGRSIGEVVAQGRNTLLQREERRPVFAPGLAGLRAQILQAACDLDEVQLQRLLDQSFATLSADTVLGQVLEVVCQEMGQRWAEGEATVAQEHLLSTVLSRRLQRLLDFAGPVPGREVLCACMPDEHHELGIMVVTYRLRALGLRAVCLGRNLPLADLAQACSQRQPAAVFLSASRKEMLDLPGLRELVSRVQAPVIVGGAAVGPDELEPLRQAGVEPWVYGRSLDDLTSYA